MSDDTGETGESKFTPGPWITTDKARDPGCIVIHTPDGFAIATAWKLLGPNGESPDNWPVEANAQLIASAPTMHAELAHLRTVNAELVAAVWDAINRLQDAHEDMYLSDGRHHERTINTMLAVRASLLAVTDKAKATGEGGGA